MKRLGKGFSEKSKAIGKLIWWKGLCIESATRGFLTLTVSILLFPGANTRKYHDDTFLFVVKTSSHWCWQGIYIHIYTICFFSFSCLVQSRFSRRHLFLSSPVLLLCTNTVSTSRFTTKVQLRIHQLPMIELASSHVLQLLCAACKRCLSSDKLKCCILWRTQFKLHISYFRVRREREGVVSVINHQDLSFPA